MANRNRNYGGGSRFNTGSNVNPWQSGTSPGRGSGLLNQNILNQLSSPDSQLAVAAKLLSSILPVQQGGQPPSLMSLGGGVGGGYGGSGYRGGYGNDRYRRDDRRGGSGDKWGNRRPANRDRNKGGDRPRNKKPEDEPSKEGESHSKEGEGEDEQEKTEGHQEREGPIAEYVGIPSKLFHCHVCGKSMWNDVSYDTHIKGRNHRNKLHDLEENYQMQTDLMRQIAAVSLKLEEMRRGGKRRPYPEQYCKMCELHFNGMTMFAHRATEEHQNLKRFIHPSCSQCEMDFQVRIEYDEHILTAAHLQNETKALNRREMYEKDPKYVALREEEAKYRLVLDEARDIGNKGSKDVSEEDRKLIESVLGEESVPQAYDPDAEIPVGVHQVDPVSGFLCKICRVFVLSEETVEVHCKTQKHYESYVHKLKADANKGAKERETEAEKRKSEGAEDGDEAKRRKVEEEEGVNGKIKEEAMDTNPVQDEFCDA